MESVSQNIVVGVIIVIAALVNIACNVYRAINSGRRTPPLAEDQATHSTRLSTIESWLSGKQSKALCDQRYGEISRMLKASTQRHSTHEEKISRQIGALHTRINDVFGELREISGSVKTHVENPT